MPLEFTDMQTYGISFSINYKINGKSNLQRSYYRFWVKW